MHSQVKWPLASARMLEMLHRFHVEISSQLSVLWRDKKYFEALPRRRVPSIATVPKELHVFTVWTRVPANRNRL